MNQEETIIDELESMGFLVIAKKEKKL